MPEPRDHNAGLVTEAVAQAFEKTLRRQLAAGDDDPETIAIARGAILPRLITSARARYGDDHMAAVFHMLAVLAAAVAMVGGIMPERRARLERTFDQVRRIYADLVEDGLIVAFDVERDDPPAAPPEAST